MNDILDVEKRDIEKSDIENIDVGNKSLYIDKVLCLLDIAKRM